MNLHARLFRVFFRAGRYPFPIPAGQKLEMVASPFSHTLQVSNDLRDRGSENIGLVNPLIAPVVSKAYLNRVEHTDPDT